MTTVASVRSTVTQGFNAAKHALGNIPQHLNTLAATTNTKANELMKTAKSNPRAFIGVVAIGALVGAASLIGLIFATVVCCGGKKDTKKLEQQTPNGDVNKSEEGKVNKSEEGKVNKSEEGKVNKSEEGKVNKSEEGKVNESEKGEVQQLPATPKKEIDNKEQPK